MQQDVRDLIRQGLVQRGTFEGPDANPRELLTLTKNGHHLVRANRLVPEGQSTYHGFVKPKEANHDADLYRLYQKEAGKILDKSGRNLRVVLDYELKRQYQISAGFGTESRPRSRPAMASKLWATRFPCPTSASSTKHARETWAVWTWNSRPRTTVRAKSPTKHAPASRSMPRRAMPIVCAVFSINMNSPRRS